MHGETLKNLRVNKNTKRESHVVHISPC